ncbi:MAG: hypothetical protein D6706_21615 [Chloroflexi bacterium]|nr:MAG: hypothetical protein D6706_21615 [Chloroflexota bacterium]
MKQRDVFWFWLPLFASWLLMTAEGPIVSATINRLPNEVIMLAAQGIVVSLSVTIESPIINMLATSTALVRDRASFLLVRRFTVHWMLGLTAVTVAIAFTPLFDLVVVRLLEAPPAVARWVRPGLQIMTLWSAAIAWRRFLQGVLIHFNQPRKVAWGTAVRLLASGGTAVSLAMLTQWPGVIIGATSLMAGVISEAAYATWAIRPLLRHELSPDSPVAPGDPLTYRQLFWFHLPLAATTLLTLLAQPLVTFTLARLDNPTESLAAWPVLFQVMLMARAAAFALPEVVIALSQKPDTFLPLRRFSLNLTVVLTVAITFFVFSPTANFYIFIVQDMTETVGSLAMSSLAFFILYPGLATLTSWLRGLLIHHHATRDVNVGMAINLTITAVFLFGGLALHTPGLITAAIALNIASLGEVLYLIWRVSLKLPAHLPLFGPARLSVSN